MIKQPTLIRDRIIRHLHELRIQISQLPEFERDALMALGGVPYEDPDALTATANILLERLGCAVPKVQDPRFDKTKRALAKTAKPLRGAKTFDSGKDRKKAATIIGPASPEPA